MNISLGFMRHKANPQQDQFFIDFAMSNGINSFETCEFYMDYKCESYVYSLLNKYSRKKYNIYGKMPKYIIKQNKYKELFKQQINKVPNKYFNYYLLQALDETCLYTLLSTDIIDYFFNKKEQGYIQNLGISIQCTPDITKKLLNLAKWDLIQMPLNYFDWYLCYGKENYELALNYNLPIVAQAPVKGGLLQDYQEAYSFISNLNNIQTVLCGNTQITTLQQTQYYLNNFKQLNEEYYLNKIKQYKQNNFIKCLGCGKCTTCCSANIPLTAIIQMYNRSLVNQDCFYDFQLLKHNIGEPVNNCIQCKKCVEICPLKLNIPKLLQDQIFELRT